MKNPKNKLSPEGYLTLLCSYLIIFVCILSIILVIAMFQLSYVFLGLLFLGLDILLLFKAYILRLKALSTRQNARDCRLLHLSPISDPIPAPSFADSEDDVHIPRSFKGCPLAYHYSDVETVNSDFDLAMQAANAHQWQLDAEVIDHQIYITYQHQKLAYLKSESLEKMLMDWIENDEPFKVLLENINTETKDVSLFLAFYRSLEKQMQGRSFDVVRLTHFSSEDCQLALDFCEPNTRCDLDDDFDSNGNDIINVSVLDGVIGRLPKKITQKCTEDFPALCVIEKIDYDADRDRSIPFVRLYW